MTITRNLLAFAAALPFVLTTSLPAVAQDLLPIVTRAEAEAYPENLKAWIGFVRENAKSFPLVKVNTAVDKPTLEIVPLTTALQVPPNAKIHDGQHIGGFRFKAPADADLYWSCAYPSKEVGPFTWMIVSVKPLAKEPRFTDFASPKVDAATLPGAPTAAHTRVDQTVPKAAFIAGEEYVIVFATKEPKDQLPLFVSLNFFKTDDLTKTLLAPAYQPAKP